MLRHSLILVTALSGLSLEAAALERNYTIRGEGYVDPAGRGRRVELREVRMTLRDNGEFIATLYTRMDRIIVRGNWYSRGNGQVDRIDIDRAFGLQADGSGSLVFDRRDRGPDRLILEGRTRQGRFVARIDDRDNGRWRDDDDDDWRRDRDDRDRDRRRGRDRDDRYDRDGRGDRDGVLGRNDRLYANIDATTNGRGMVRMAEVRDGRFSVARARLGTGGDVRIDIDRETRGTIRGEVVSVRGDRVTVRITDMFGHRATGEMVVVMRNAQEIERMDGSGRANNGSWQLDFEGSGGRW